MCIQKFPLIVKIFRKDIGNLKGPIGNPELIVRFLLSPLHFKNNGVIRSNAFNPTPGTDEVSVSRLKIYPIKKTKEIAKKFAAKNKKNVYCGFALHTKFSALNCGAKDIVSDPSPENIAHAELKLGIVRTNDPIPAELMQIIDSLATQCKLLKDPDPSNEEWLGDAPKY